MSATQLQQLHEACSAFDRNAGARCKESFYASIQKPAQACWNCNAALTLEKIKKCSKCHLAIYCGQACQRQDWAVHKQPEGCVGFSRKLASLQDFHSVPRKWATAKDLAGNTKKIEGKLLRMQKALSDCLEFFSKTTEDVREQEKLLKELRAVKDASVSDGSPQAAVLIANFEQASQQLDSYKQRMNEMQQQTEMYTQVIGKLKSDWSHNQQLMKDLHASGL
jgi:hypothetical protein